MLIKYVIFLFVVIFANAISMIVGSYAGQHLPFTKGTGFNWWFVLASSAGSFAAAFMTAPFLVILFQRRRWLAALISTSPLLLLIHSRIYAEILIMCVVYFSLLLVGIWVTSHVLELNKKSTGLKY